MSTKTHILEDINIISNRDIHIIQPLYLTRDTHAYYNITVPASGEEPLINLSSKVLTAHQLFA